MKVLLIGGTGPIGNAITENNFDHVFYVTTRQKLRSNQSNLIYIKANAMEDNDLAKVLKYKYDVIIDFMNYSTIKFAKRYLVLLKATDHYIFISSARVYSNSYYKIDSKSMRFIYENFDSQYRLSDEYALAKAKQEDILLKSGFKNYTIVRPYITHHHNRLQFGPLEKEEWLKGILKHKFLVVYEGMLETTTTMTSAVDVAKYIGLIIDNSINDKIVNVASNEFLTWREILAIYEDVLKNDFNLELNLISISKDDFVSIFGHEEQINYDRVYDRRFRMEPYHILPFSPTNSGLRKSLSNLIIKGNKINMNCEYEMSLLTLTQKRNLVQYYKCKMLNKIQSTLKG
jgi:nucleoside-diphosphate-sugar epimerase